ncbi:MAG: helix-turn-helix domain-containing protein [Candidatus Bathyarchaeia archaeon]
MIDVMLLFASVFFIIAVGFAAVYYKYLVKVKREYEKAKAAFNEIILSFSRELKRTSDNVETILYKVEASSSRSSDAAKKVERVEEKVGLLEKKTDEIWEHKDKLLGQISDLEKLTRDIIASRDELAKKISVLEEKVQQAPMFPEPGVEAVIPIKREKALANLTDTELAVLEMLAKEGPKTAPEIKERVKLSREHTARLMKKLYEEGYLERDSSKIPFKYSAKKEMEKFLKKTETETA